MATSIPGYTYGTAEVARSPVTLEELELLKKTVLFGDDDVKALEMSREVLRDQVDAILDVWYGFVGANPHLLAYFSRKSDRKPEPEYLERVRKRFGQWILDTASANYDQKWLDYQHEIGLRHHYEKKNKTDNASGPEVIHFRYLTTLIFPIVHTLKPFLARKGHSAQDVEKMQNAWLKSVLIQITLWCQPYVKQGSF